VSGFVLLEYRAEVSGQAVDGYGEDHGAVLEGRWRLRGLSGDVVCRN
jgi:hypothetical protein